MGKNIGGQFGEVYFPQTARFTLIRLLKNISLTFDLSHGEGHSRR